MASAAPTAPPAKRAAKREGPKVEEGMRRARDGEEPPSKRFFRQRAHINPLNQTATFQ